MTLQQESNTHSNKKLNFYPEWSKRNENLNRREKNQVSTEALSKRQSQIYDSIVAHVNEYGFAPTVRELCKLTGLASTSSIVMHLKALETKGYIKRYPTQPRAITILQ